MTFLIEHQYIILYFSGAFFSFFAMLSYVKLGNSFLSGRRKLDNHEDFFGDFDNDDLEALLDESFDVDSFDDNIKASGSEVSAPGDFSFPSGQLEIEPDKLKIEPAINHGNINKGKSR